MMVLVEFLLLWEIWTEFLTPGFDLTVIDIWEVKQKMILSLSLSVFLPFKE